MDKVIAVVVTHNRRQLLSECLDALREQTRKPDAILVINNGSTDDTEYWLKSQPDVECITQGNAGGAGGFSRGIQTGYVRGYHWIWCMDDDGKPHEQALENLLAAENHELRLLNCAVVDKTDRKSFVWKTGSYKTIEDVKEKEIAGIGHPFNGTLIHYRIIERVGVPKRHFFLWGDETEYYYRITRRNQIPVVTVTNSLHFHPASAFKLTQNWDYNQGWKLYYYIRNRYHVLKSKSNSKLIAAMNYCFFLLAFAGLTLLFQRKDKWKKIQFIAWPARDSFRNNFSVTPDLVLNRLQYRKEHGLRQLWAGQLRGLLVSIFLPTVTPTRSESAAV
mgnify:CR=1 FL=1|jgi:GT2 family glycosyltransferase